MDIPIPLSLAIILPWILLGLGTAMGWFLKPHPLRGKTLLVGLRPSSGRALIRPIHAVRGVHTWKEKGDFRADIDLDNAFLWDERALGIKVCEVDLDTTQPIRYEGSAKTLIENGALLDKEKVKRLTALEKKRAEAKLSPEENAELIQIQQAEAAIEGYTRTGAAQPLRYQGVCITDAETVTVDYFGEKRELKHLWKRLTGVRLYLIRKDTRLRQLAAIGGSMWDFLTKIAPIALIVLCLLTVIILIILLKQVM